ncbi:MAG: outer membrane lipoprotein chaperone LolA [Burkholderiaceae bacterium]|nr:outer membrane lipoprotein chaperone LolA [Burkholderiaceae bacterium]
MKKILTAIFIAASACAASADGLKSLESFMQNTRSAQAEFTQEVTAPAKNGQAPRTRTSSGSFAFERPGQFRFDYKKPFAQTIVADGKTLWLYDADLNQVTERAQSKALGSTPAALLASAPNLQALTKDFVLESAPEQDGLQWVNATPKAKDGQLQSVRVGLRGEQLAALEILDSFGQRSLIRFENVQANPDLPSTTFDFKVPQGADVLKQ